MKQVYLVYLFDDIDPLDVKLIGVATTHDIAVSLAATDAEWHHHPMSAEERKELSETEEVSLSEMLNYYIRPFDTDTL